MARRLGRPLRTFREKARRDRTSGFDFGGTASAIPARVDGRNRCARRRGQTPSPISIFLQMRVYDFLHIRIT